MSSNLEWADIEKRVKHVQAGKYRDYCICIQIRQIRALEK